MSSSVFPNAVEKLTMIKIDKRLKECADGGGKKLDFSGLGLTSFDSGIIEKFSTTLEELNLGDNLLSSFPTNFTELKRLRILFCANNKFKDVPVILGSMSSLYMLSFKGNEVVHVHEESLSPSICWLILTDNQITALPASIGKLRGLRKCMLAGNRLRSLPREMAGCVELELLRLAANNLEEIPDWLLKLPKLAWLALAGNRCLPSVDDSIPSDDNASNIVPTFKKRDIIMGDRIGDGASGVVYEARMRDTNEQVAVKVFKGECTSDGRPADEMRAAMYVFDTLFTSKSTLVRYLTPVLPCTFAPSIALRVGTKHSTETIMGGPFPRSLESYALETRSPFSKNLSREHSSRWGYPPPFRV